MLDKLWATLLQWQVKICSLLVQFLTQDLASVEILTTVLYLAWKKCIYILISIFYQTNIEVFIASNKNVVLFSFM